MTHNASNSAILKQISGEVAAPDPAKVEAHDFGSFELDGRN